MAWVLIALIAWIGIGCVIAFVIGGASQLGDNPQHRRPQYLPMGHAHLRSLALTPPARQWGPSEETGIRRAVSR